MPRRTRDEVGNVSNSKHLTRALTEVLEPLVRLCLAKGITYPLVDDLLRTLFVSVADRDFLLDGKAKTQSRTSIVTGIHRREVKRLIARRDQRGAVTERATRGGELVARWISMPPYVDARGRPMPLACTISRGGRRSFEALVASFSKDIRARAILDEWRRIGVVTLDAKDRVHLNVDSFVAPQGLGEQAFYFGQNVGDHIAAGVANLLGQQTSFPDRSVWRDELSPNSIKRLAHIAERLTMRAISRVNRQAERLEAIDKRSGKATHRLNFGFYVYSARASSATWRHNGNKSPESLALRVVPARTTKRSRFVG